MRGAQRWTWYSIYKKYSMQSTIALSGKHHYDCIYLVYLDIWINITNYIHFSFFHFELQWGDFVRLVITLGGEGGLYPGGGGEFIYGGIMSKGDFILHPFRVGISNHQPKELTEINLCTAGVRLPTTIWPHVSEMKKKSPQKPPEFWNLTILWTSLTPIRRNMHEFWAVNLLCTLRGGVVWNLFSHTCGSLLTKTNNKL